MFFFVLLTHILKAQWDFNLSVENEYNSNPFISPEPTGSYISTISLGLENEMDAFSLGYYGSYLNIDAVRERNFYWHQLALWKNFESSTFGIYAEQRINKTEYEYYNYTNYVTYYRNLIALDNFFITLTPNVSLTKYSNIPILDNLKFGFSGMINRSFETGTTFILGGSLNIKKYLDPTQTETLSYTDENNKLIRETFIDENISSITQVVPFIRIAQSITPTTGLAFQFTNRTVLTKFENNYKDLNMIYGDESEIFDDPVNYEGNNITFELTQILFDDLYLRGGFYLNKKFYPSQGTYDQTLNYDTKIMRTDNQKIINLSIKKNFYLGVNENIVLYTLINFQYIKNESNSYWFNYIGNSISIDLGIEF